MSLVERGDHATLRRSRSAITEPSTVPHGRSLLLHQLIARQDGSGPEFAILSRAARCSHELHEHSL